MSKLIAKNIFSYQWRVFLKDAATHTINFD